MKGLVRDGITSQDFRLSSSVWHCLTEKCFFIFLFNVSETFLLCKLLQRQHYFINFCFNFRSGFCRIIKIIKELEDYMFCLKW